MNFHPGKMLCFFCKVPFFTDPTGSGILMSLANAESQAPAAEVQSKATWLKNPPLLPHCR